MAGFLGAQDRCRAMSLCGCAVLDVIEQQAGVCQQVRVDPEQLTGLPRDPDTSLAACGTDEGPNNAARVIPNARQYNSMYRSAGWFWPDS
jgi:hypothetical protein